MLCIYISDVCMYECINVHMYRWIYIGWVYLRATPTSCVSANRIVEQLAHCRISTAACVFRLDTL